jgi:heavy metal sensor kinase
VFRGSRVQRVGGLRLRLTLSYILLFAVVLVIVGLLFRRNLEQNLEAQHALILAEEWGAVRGFLHVDTAGRHRWQFDLDDPEEGRIVERLRGFLMITDLDGRVLEMSELFHTIGGATPAEIAAARAAGAPAVVKKVRDGATYLIRQGLLRESERDYYLAIAIPISNSEPALQDFTRGYFLLALPLLMGVAGLGWLLAGGALQPLNDLVGATQRISGENLRYRLLKRGTGDELDTLVENFNEMLERLDRSFLQIRQFNVDASHELRTPITAIRGQLEVALFTAKDESDYRRAIETSLQDVERMGQVVKSLLLLSQAESGQVILEMSRFDASAALENFVHQYQLLAEEKGVRLIPVIPPGIRLEADRAQFERLVSNLLSNAVRFTPGGGEVRVSLSARSDQVFLTVSDSGPGIGSEHLPHIFDRFYRAVHSEKELEKGLGLGLSFVKWIVEAHKGSIEVRTEAGRGATFIVALPAPVEEPFPVLQPDATPENG